MWAPMTTSAGHGEAVETVEPSEKASYGHTAMPTAKEILATVKGVNEGDSSSLEDQDRTLRATKSTREDAAGMRRMGKDQ